MISMILNTKPHQHKQPTNRHNKTVTQNPNVTFGWLTIEEAANYASVSKRTISNWIKKGLKHVRQNRKTIRIHPTDIDEFLFRDYSTTNPNAVDIQVDSILNDLTK